MTTRVSAPRSSKVTVVTAPSSPPSSFVQTRRECGTTSLYRPKNAIGSGEARWLNTRRYVPPTRTSISQDSRDRPNDFGTHHRLNSSGLVQASNTRRAGALKVSRDDELTLGFAFHRGAVLHGCGLTSSSCVHRTRPTFSVVTSPACSRTPTCFFIPVRVRSNFSARSVIDASAQMAVMPGYSPRRLRHHRADGRR